MNKIKERLLKLEETEKKIMILRHYENMSFEDINKILNINYSNLLYNKVISQLSNIH